jgi:hypothetical protein
MVTKLQHVHQMLLKKRHLGNFIEIILTVSDFLKFKFGQIHYFVFLVMLMSIPFLIITFCVYGVIRELRNLHGKCLMCYVLSLTIFYITQMVTYFWSYEMSNNKQVCSIFGYTNFTSILMSFFWLNAMCYDIWSTFR